MSGCGGCRSLDAGRLEGALAETRLAKTVDGLPRPGTLEHLALRIEAIAPTLARAVGASGLDSETRVLRIEHFQKFLRESADALDAFRGTE